MKIRLESESQEEFDLKRPEIIKAIAGSKYDVELKRKGQVSQATPRQPYFKAQGQMLEHWQRRYKAAVKDIKEQVLEIIEE